jgi:hypothetical protein
LARLTRIEQRDFKTGAQAVVGRGCTHDTRANHDHVFSHERFGISSEIKKPPPKMMAMVWVSGDVDFSI